MSSSGAPLDSIPINSSLMKSPVPEVACAFNLRPQRIRFDKWLHSTQSCGKLLKQQVRSNSSLRHMTNCFLLFCFGFVCLFWSVLFSKLLRCRTKSLVFHQQKLRAKAFYENDVGTYTTASYVGNVSYCSIHYLQYVAFLACGHTMW